MDYWTIRKAPYAELKVRRDYLDSELTALYPTRPNTLATIERLSAELQQIIREQAIRSGYVV